MKLIGIKRLLVLAVLIGLNALIATAYFLWLSPSLEEAQAKLAGINGDISTLRGKIQNTKQELAEYQTNLPAYEAMKSNGFMSGQDRFQITRDLDAVRQNAGGIGFNFRIDDLKTIDSQAARDAGMKVVDSRINIDNITTLLDLDIYSFVNRMQREFPAHLRLSSIRIERKDKLNRATLARLQRKDNVALINANLVFDWITYVPEIDPAQKK